MNLGEAYLDHYQRFLGQVTKGKSLEFEGANLQLLEFDSVMKETHILASLGLTHYQDFLGDVVEVVVPVSAWDEMVWQAVMSSLTFLLTVEASIPEISYLRHTHRTVPEFYKKYGKSALAFTAPYPFPDEFARVPLKSSGMNGKVRMGYFLTEAEVKCAEQHGMDALEILFEETSADVIDLTRPSVI